MKKTITLLLVLALVCTMSFTVFAEKKTSYKLAYLTDTLDQSQTGLAGYMKEYSADVAERDGIEIEFNTFDAHMSLTEQMATIENCVVMGYDGVILNPVDVEGILPTAQAAMADGLVICDIRSSNDLYQTQIDVAAEPERGELIKQWILSYMDEHPDEVFYVGLLHGAPTTPQVMPRVDVPETIANERPDNFIVLAEQYCPNWTTDDAIKIVEDWIQAYPQMNFIISAAEQLAYGAAQVIEQAGLSDQFKQVTVNGEPMGIEMMRNGQLIMDCGTFLPANAAGAVQTLLGAINGTMSGFYDYSQYTVFMMTPENADEVEARYNNIDWSTMGEPRKVR